LEEPPAEPERVAVELGPVLERFSFWHVGGDLAFRPQRGVDDEQYAS